MIQLRLCDCGAETVYARGMGYRCYKAWWIANKAVVQHGTKAKGSNYGRWTVGLACRRGMA